MAKSKTSATKPIATKSPFKDVADFDRDLKSFSNKFKILIADHSKRISDYYEISCFNMVVRYYERSGYTVMPDNIIRGQYRYKCTPRGTQSNFSHFTATIGRGSKKKYFEIHHNLPIQSAHEPTIFTTPDIAVIIAGQLKYKKDYYEKEIIFSYVENQNAFTFFEAKNFVPFPELLFSFMGVVNELAPEILNGHGWRSKNHLAPSLLVSGRAGAPVKRIKNSLEKRYEINILFDLFYTSSIYIRRDENGSLVSEGIVVVDDEDLLF